MRRTAYILTLIILTSCQFKNTWECDGDCHNGEGTKKWKDGGIERGTWKNGELIGKGYQFFGKTSDFAGDYYEGEFLNGYHGFGSYYFADEDIKYIGEFKHGKLDGKGKAIHGQNSDTPGGYYDGEWKNGLRHGYGVSFKGQAGKDTDHLYQGEWKNDERHGHGRYYWPDEGTHIGPWKNGVQHGEGIYIFLNGDTIRSRWINGYCKDLAVLETGKDTSYFKTHIEEIRIPSFEVTKRFIGVAENELRKFYKDSSYNVDFYLLRELLDTALFIQKKILPKLEDIKEYDANITYKQDILDIEYSLMDALKAFDNWINLSIDQANEKLLQQSFDTVYEKLKIMKERQNEFEKTKKRFTKKYWD
jgi:hypothetical protein